MFWGIGFIFFCNRNIVSPDATLWTIPVIGGIFRTCPGLIVSSFKSLAHFIVSIENIKTFGDDS